MKLADTHILNLDLLSFIKVTENAGLSISLRDILAVIK